MSAQLGADDLKIGSQTSCSVLKDLGPQIQWVHSYVTDNKIYCVYRAPNEEMIREHAQRGGFPANKISQVNDDRPDHRRVGPGAARDAHVFISYARADEPLASARSRTSSARRASKSGATTSCRRTGLMPK